MLDAAVRASVLILGGATLALVATWFAPFAYQEIRDTGQVVIDTPTVIDDSDNELGKALAVMLQPKSASFGDGRPGCAFCPR